MQMVLLTALGVGGATVIGAAIGFIFKKASHRFSDIILAFAAGVMLAAAVLGLILPSIEYGGRFGLLITIAGIFTGALCLNLVDKLVPHLHRLMGNEDENHSGNEKINKVLLFVLAIAIHNLPEGIAAGVGFGSGNTNDALLIAGGIALQNIPEGIVTVSPLVMSGVKRSRAFVLASVTVALVVNNIQLMFHGGRDIQFNQIAYFELFATLLSVIVIVSLRKLNHESNSPILKAEMMEWSIDAIASIGMSVAFFIPILIDNPHLQPLLPYFDQVIAIFLSCFILPLPIRAVVMAMRDIFLMAPEEEMMGLIKEKCEPILTLYHLHETTYDVVRTGRKLWISIYVIPNGEFISVRLYSNVQDLLQKTLEEEFSDFYIELLPDIS